MAAANEPAAKGVDGKASGPPAMIPLTRMFSLVVVAVTFGFVFNNFLIFWGGWPGLPDFFAHVGVPGFAPLRTALEPGAVMLGATQVALYGIAIAGAIAFVLRTPDRTMHADAELLSNIVNYIVRGCFWGILLIGIVDAAISFMRVEGVLQNFVGAALAEDIGRNSFRGTYIHYPLILAGFVIAVFVRDLGFHWLALLIVIAEFQIVIFRFVFSYEQAFMADLVRMWYGALFLFASAYTLIEEGHVRVDILYAGFSRRGKAWANMVGSIVLGAPLCWVILAMGMWTKSNVINGPLLSFEVTQQGFGLYVKYLLAGFLLVFALTMLIQFMGYFLRSAAILLRAPGSQAAAPAPATAATGSAAAAKD